MVALLLLSLTASADDRIFSVGRCQNLEPADEARLRAIDQRLTRRAALAAESELRVRLAAKLTEPARRDPSTSALMATLEGWLTKKEWLAAQARHEHDADEAGDYCEFLRRQAGTPP
jgi:hypothetical protein